MARAHIHIRNYVSSVLRDQASSWRGKQQGDDATARVRRSIQKGLQDAGDVSRREIRVGQLAQAEQRDTHLVVLLQLERAPREQRAHAPRLAQRVAVGVVQDHKLCRSRCRISS